MDFVFHVLNGKIYFFFVNTYESCVSNRRFLQHARGLGTVRELGQRACMRYPDSSGSRPWCSESLVWWACQSQLRSGKGEVWPSQKSDRLPSPSSMSTEGSNEHRLDHCTCSKSTGPKFSTAYWRRYAWARRSGTLSERTYFFHGKIYWTSGRTQKLNRVVNTDIGSFFSWHRIYNMGSDHFTISFLQSIGNTDIRETETWKYCQQSKDKRKDEFQQRSAAP